MGNNVWLKINERIKWNARYVFPFALALSVLIIDQVVKIWVKTHMMIGESFPIFGQWSYIYFTENPGMAFGMQFGGEIGKILLTLFRIALVTVGSVYIYRLMKKNAPMYVLLTLSLIFAGALGNIIDSLFYGLIFSDSYGHIATVFPPEGGYAPFLQGRVVDMFYFPVIETTYPSWFPVWGGEEFVFFRPIFNVADSAITIGACCLFIIIIRRKYYNAT